MPFGVGLVSLGPSTQSLCALILGCFKLYRSDIGNGMPRPPLSHRPSRTRIACTGARLAATLRANVQCRQWLRPITAHKVHYEQFSAKLLILQGYRERPMG